MESINDVLKLVSNEKNTDIYAYDEKRNETVWCMFKFDVIGVKQARQLVKELVDINTKNTLNESNSLLLIMCQVRKKISHYALNLFREIEEEEGYGIRIQYFHRNHLLVNPLTYKYTPVHEIVTTYVEEEKESLPKIYDTDIVIRLLGGTAGEICKITRPYPGGQDEIVYRQIVSEDEGSVVR